MRMQISAGRGPAEVVDFVADLARFFAAWVHDEGGTASLPTWGPDRRSATFVVHGVPLEGWVGTHELVDPVRGRGRRRRWFVDVRLLDVTSLAPFDPDRIRFTAARAGGPGGQHVNTTASAVRAVYEPTGWEVRVADERSQHRNRAEAVRRLRARHQDAQAAERAAGEQRAWQAHETLVRGQPAVRWTRQSGRLTPSGGC